MLVLEDVHVYYGDILALHGIDLQIKEGELITLIGSNGAGKSTCLQAISGLVHPKRGKIIYKGEDITHILPYEAVKRGISLVPEGRHIFAGLTVKENLIVGSIQRKDPGGIAADLNYMYSLFPILKRRLSQKAGTLSGGEQQMLAISRALLNKPKLLLLDEPSLGLAPIRIQEIFEVIQKVQSSGCTIMLVEQNARKALEIADRGYVLELGSIVLEGLAQELRADKKVEEAYFGGES
jgi:branched-chain amino acid transport system ATP-binding protein